MKGKLIYLRHYMDMSLKEIKKELDDVVELEKGVKSSKEIPTPKDDGKCQKKVKKSNS